jgi:hypothetical protein
MREKTTIELSGQELTKAVGFYLINTARIDPEEYKDKYSVVLRAADGEISATATFTRKGERWPSP